MGIEIAMEEAKMRGYNGNHEAKKKLLRQVEAHRKADEIVQGVYWQNGKGCALGCMVHSADHVAGTKLLGVPLAYVHLMDSIFERLPNAQAKKFPGQVARAVKVGADYSRIVDRFLLALLADPRHGTRRVALKHPESLAATDRVIELFRRQLAGERISAQEWKTEAAAEACAEAGSPQWQSRLFLRLLKDAE